MTGMTELSEEEADVELLGQIFRSEALSIKGRLVAMQQISQAYSQVSLEYIMPGFEIVGRMALSEFVLTSGQVSAKSSELSRYNSSATENIRSIVLQVGYVT